jgi:molybdopterin synthase catalytic subunit
LTRVIRIVADPIDVTALLAEGAGPASGGVVLFLGTVREQTGGRPVVKLEYEAYGDMALDEITRIVEEARRRFAVGSIDVVHRVGTLALGEVAVAVVVRAAHRGGAFDACRFVIDELKKSVPIWKKEFYRDGEVWVGDRP